MDKISVGLRNEVIKRMTQQANRAQTVLNLYVPRVRDAGLPNLADDLAQHVGIAIQTNANIVKQLVEDADVIHDPVPSPEPPPPPPPPPPDPEPEPDPEPPPPPPPPVTSSRPFTSANSPFGQPIPANPEIDPNSAAMVSYLVERENLRAFNMAVSAWTVPLFYADANTPRYDVPLTKAAGWGWPSPMKGVPIPANAVPDPQGDSHLAIIDTSTGCLYEFWQAKKTSTGWSASSGNAIPLNSNGIYPDGRSVTASGFSILAGRIWPEELANGHIPHALFMGYNGVASGLGRLPATKSDGTHTHAGAIPMGGRLQLDPSLDLDTLNLRPYEKTIARALQEYGAFIGDSAGAPSFYAVHASSFPAGAYSMLPSGSSVLLDRIPASKFRVLKLGAPTTRNGGPFAPSPCLKW